MTSDDLVILIPVLGRPHRVAPLLQAVTKTTPKARVLFLCDPDDELEKEAIDAAGAPRIDVDGNYAVKIRTGIEVTKEPLVFTGADDLEPQEGWFEKAGECLVNGIQVVGVNDGIARHRLHSTHFLMTREYATTPTIDGKPGPFCDEYCHWYMDDEFIITAERREVYYYCKDAIVKHLHPMNETAPDDETYKKGRLNWRLDRHLHFNRAGMWT